MPRKTKPAPGGHREAGSDHNTRQEYSNVIRFPARPPPTISQLIRRGQRRLRACLTCGGPLIVPPVRQHCADCTTWDRLARRHGVGGAA